MKNNGVKFGLIYGGLSIVLSVITYFTAPENLISFTSWSAIVGWILMFICMFISAKKTRDDNNGFISFGEALVPPVITFLIGNIMVMIYMYLLVVFIDPDIQEVLRQSTLDMQRGILEMAGRSEDQILEELEKIEAEVDVGNQFSIGSLGLGVLSNTLIIGLPISAMIAAILKKKEPIIQP